jgi:hypothetical protein
MTDLAHPITLPADDSLEALRQRRQDVARLVATLTFDLGGLTVEMATSGEFHLDVLVRRAAEVRTADAELGELQRLLAAADAGVVGQCRRCSASHARGAIYCWRCGESLAYAVPPSANAPA